MSEAGSQNTGAMSADALLLSLRDITLPSDAAGGFWAEMAAAVAMAGLAALVLAFLVRLVSRRGGQAARMRHDPLAALDTLPEDIKRVHLLHLLRDVAPDRYNALRPKLYRPDGGLDLDTLEAEVARHV